MLQDSVLSTQIIAAPFAFPRNIPKAALVDFEYGGVAIQDPSQGLRVKVWRAEYVDGAVVVSADGVTPTTIITVAHITQIGFAFDANMKPFVCYQLENGDAKYYWFDSTVPGFVTSTLPTGTDAPLCAHDDTRNTQVRLGRSDIILTYTRAGSLYFRAQRERYLTEHLLSSEIGDGQLLQVGMNQKLRFQWRLSTVVGDSPGDSP